MKNKCIWLLSILAVGLTSCSKPTKMMLTSSDPKENLIVEITEIGGFVTDAVIKDPTTLVTLITKRLTPCSDTYSEDDDSLKKIHLAWLLQDKDCQKILHGSLQFQASDVKADIPPCPADPILKQQLIETAQILELYADPKVMGPVMNGQPKNTLKDVLHLMGTFGPLGNFRKRVDNHDPRAGFLFYADADFMGYGVIGGCSRPGCGEFAGYKRDKFDHKKFKRPMRNFLICYYAPFVARQGQSIFEGESLKYLFASVDLDDHSFTHVLTEVGFTDAPPPEEALEINPIPLLADGKIDESKIKQILMSKLMADEKIPEDMSPEEKKIAITQQVFYGKFKDTLMTFKYRIWFQSTDESDLRLRRLMTKPILLEKCKG